MSSTWGDSIKVSIFGESHGEAIGVVIDGLPSGEPLDFEEIMLHMRRRAPGTDRHATPRTEPDKPRVLSGLIESTTTGAPLAVVIENTNTRSQDYSLFKASPRPGHADFTGALRYGGFNDIRGGGHFSGRLTAPLVFAGSVCRQILRKKGIEIGAHIYSVGEASDTPFDPVSVSSELLLRLQKTSFALIDENSEDKIRAQISAAMDDGDSIGGTVECAVCGIPAGRGTPMFHGAENLIASIIFGIPAIKGVEFGAGFMCSKMRGSQCNDGFTYGGDETLVTASNNCGGILGGITNGMPLIFRAAVKPTPSIAKEQQTVNLETKQNTVISVAGRHDPCIVPRAVPVIESAAAIAVINLI